MIFPSTRDREVAFKLSVSLRNLLLRYHPAPVMRACSWMFYELVYWTNVSLRTNILLLQEIYISGRQLSPLAGLSRRATSRRCQSVVTSQTLPDPIKPSVKLVKSGMKAFVVRMKHIADHENPQKKVVTL
jgi:hypothetical protein